MTAHDFADHLDIRRAIASKDVGDIPEVARAQQTRSDDCEETGVNVAECERLLLAAHCGNRASSSPHRGTPGGGRAPGRAWPLSEFRG